MEDCAAPSGVKSAQGSNVFGVGASMAKVLPLFFVSLACIALPAMAQPPAPLSPTQAPPALAVVARARQEVERAVSYDGRWVPIRYPGGDVPAGSGVCTDVVIRGYRAAGLDLQQLVHEDVVRAPSAYAGWVKRPDANIDHRRVGPLGVYLQRHAARLPVDDAKSYAPGDVVIISFAACPACSPQHVGVVSDRKGPRGLPLMIHNLGPTPTEDDTLDAWPRLAHYRLLP